MTRTRLLRPHRPPLSRPDRHADGLGPSPPRSRRRHLHRPARPRRTGAGRLRPGSRGNVRHGGNAAQRVSASPSRAACARAPRARSTRTCTSGEIEVLAHELEVLNASLTPPFQLDDENLSETVRLDASRPRPAPAADAEQPDAALSRGDGGARATSTRTASSTSRRRSSTSPRPRARASSSCRRASITASSTRCRSRRSSSSRC